MRRWWVGAIAIVAGACGVGAALALADTSENWARTAKGAVVAPGDATAAAVPGCDPSKLLDDDPGTGWSAPAAGTEAQRTATFRLATAIDVEDVGVVTDPVCAGHGPDAEAVDFDVQTSSDGVTFSELPADGVPGVRYVRIVLEDSDGADWIDIRSLEVTGSPSAVPTQTAQTTATATAKTTTTTARTAPKPLKGATAKKPPPPAAPRAAASTHFTGGMKLAVTCASACTSKVTLTLTASSRRALKSSRRVAFRHTFKLKSGTTLTTVRLSAAVRRTARKRHVRTLALTMSAVTKATKGGERHQQTSVHLRAY